MVIGGSGKDADGTVGITYSGAKEEGIIFDVLCNPIEIIADDKDNVKITNSGIVVTDVNKNNTLYNVNGKTKLRKGKIKFYSDDIITINNKGSDYIYNLKKRRELLIK